jgi:hypothetical protein
MLMRCPRSRWNITSGTAGRGRWWIAWGALATGVIGFLTDLALSVDMIANRQIFFYGPAFGLDYAGSYWLIVTDLGTTECLRTSDTPLTPVFVPR